MGLRQAQHTHYRYIQSQRQAETWASGLVERLLLLTHSQWIYRNAIVHHREQDSLCREEWVELWARMEEQIDLGYTNLPPEDHFLLEESLETLWEKSGMIKRT